MFVLRALVSLLLASAGVAFGLYVATGQQRFKWLGLRILRWTLGAALFFFAMLILQRIV